MTKALKFTLSGKNAFFKKPDVNTYLYFTYGNIHKVALLGMFGAIVGYDGYGQKKWSKAKKGEIIEEYPEFYEKLKDLKMAIEPLNINGYINKKVQTFNNSVGYASKEQGGNLIVKEQWLENPKWDIYIIIDNEESEKIADFIVNRKAVYFPYLGKNDHPADISNMEIVDIESIDNSNEKLVISTLFEKNIGDIDYYEDVDNMFKYEEKLPVSLDGVLNKYILSSLCFTNMYVDINEFNSLYKYKDKVLSFY